LRSAGYLPESAQDRQFADEYRQVKRPLIAAAFRSVGGSPGRSPRLVVMASALPGDGKTFTSINLALSLARERDISVLLVDADVAKPHISCIFGAEAELGLLDAVADEKLGIESLVLRTDVKGLYILPAGKSQAGATELLSSARMREQVDRLLAANPRRIVLFDSSPLLVSSESLAVIGAAGGQIVMVVRAGKTPRQAVLDALVKLGGDLPVSLILNQGNRGLAEGLYGYGPYGNYGDVPSP
jgi:exopolysaccharide/PEP-CTERM locus tyrosine autokinase